MTKLKTTLLTIFYKEILYLFEMYDIGLMQSLFK